MANGKDSTLAVRTVITAPSALHDALDGRAADATRLAGAVVDGVVHLEEAGLAVGVDVVGDRAAAELDGMFEHAPHGGAQALELLAAQAAGAPARANAGLKDHLAGVDVAHPAERALIHQQILDRHAPAAHQRAPLVER